MENIQIRMAAREAHIPLWKIAQMVGISEPTLTRWLRVELSSGEESAYFASN